MKFDYNWLENPQIFNINRLEAHSNHKFFKDLGCTEDFIYSLNGKWDFYYAKNYKDSIKIENLDFENYEKHTINVPGHIQLQGFDIPQYVNVMYPWEGKEKLKIGEVPKNFNPVATYVRKFNLPDYKKNMPLIISFQGVESAMALWINNKFVGYSEDSFTPSEFDITNYVVDEENTIIVQVFKWCSSSWLEDQDFWRFSGIFRDVFIYTKPFVHMRDIFVKPILDKELKNAVVNINHITENNINAKAKVNLFFKEEKIYEEYKNLEDREFSFNVENIRLWSSEEPNLYDLKIEVYDEEDKLQEVVFQKIGFRKIYIENSIIYLNGKRLVFNGVNRHEFSPKNGRAITKEEIIEDIKICKRNNINAIRTSHYPNQPYFYEICDEYGIYVIDEANLETHGTWASVFWLDCKNNYILPYDKEEWKENVLDRANSMWQRDKNHSCVLILSCGNESFGGKNIYEMSKLFKEKDDTRLVHYEGVSLDRRYNDTTDIESQMYTSVKDIKEFLKEHREKPFICCEYSHAMGNSNGCLEKYTKLTEEEPLYQGGFIWDFVDQVIEKNSSNGQRFYAYGGDFYDRPTDYDFSANGIVFADRTLSPKMPHVKYCYQNFSINIKEESFTIFNKNLFIDTKKYDCFAILLENGKEIQKDLIHINVPSLQTKEYSLPYNLFNMDKTKEYTVIISIVLKENEPWANKGYEIAFEQRSVGKMCIQKDLSFKPILIDDFNNIGILCKECSILFSKVKGGLISYKIGDKELIEEPIMPNFWRAPTQNDIGAGLQRKLSIWKTNSMYIKGIIKEAKENDNSVSIKIDYEMPLLDNDNLTVDYTIFGDGTIEINMELKPIKHIENIPEFGFLIKMPLDCNNFTWYGRGLEETYSDRKDGYKIGIYTKNIKESMPQYVFPQECGNHIETRYANIYNNDNIGLKIYGDSLNISALNYTPHQLENANHLYELPTPFNVVLKVSSAQMGVGGDNSWGATPHKEHMLDLSKGLKCKFYIKGIN